MNLRTFKHGIHPADGKALSANEAIRDFRPTGEMVYPLNQHIGAPAQPVVAVGDPVLVGQTLAQPGGFVSAAICSAASGTVKAIELRRTVSGKEALSIVIENDGQYTPMPGVGERRDYTALSGQQILDIIRDAGIVGQGGAGFPTHVKLTMKEGVQPETIILNAAECEPYLTSDYRLLIEKTDRVLEGLQVVLQIFPQAQAVIGIEANKPEAIRLLTEKTAALPHISVQVLKTKYPQGGERMLIHAVTGRDIHSGKLPIDAGCVVLNVSTVMSIRAAVCRGIPQIAAIMTVTGEGAASPCNVSVPVGTSHRELLAFAGGLKGEPEKLISGGPLMGVAMVSLDVPVLKTSSAILAMPEDEVARWEPTACIRCGRCLRACPEFLVPPMMAHAADNGDLGAFEKVNGMECIECGCCTYVCPAKRRLTQSFRTAKTAVNAKRRAAAAKK
ncbi:MAG: electron transport complex subunit RsxC [Clostridia bacterium]|nr:electron transport complex subunit RsxC [Clostridia bacterium]